jgi:hypothetical protein
MARGWWRWRGVAVCLEQAWARPLSRATLRRVSWPLQLTADGYEARLTIEQASPARRIGMNPHAASVHDVLLTDLRLGRRFGV